MQKRLIVILGPTASGKTELAIDLAKRLNTEIISADARQFYKEMNIGTAKPSPEALQQAKHHFINTLSVTQDYSAGQFEEDALQLIKKLFQEKNTLIMAGGSGFYIKAVCEGLDEFPEAPAGIRAELNKIFRNEGIEPLQEELKQKDPAYFSQADINNPQRVIRALEVIRTTGKPFSAFFEQKEKSKRDFEIIKIGLAPDRQTLYKHINERVDEMIAEGLIEEAKQLYPQKELNALQTVGYQELFDYFDGKTSKEEAIELIKRNTRRYAKRQFTWFRKDKDIKWFKPEAREKIWKALPWPLPKGGE